MWLPEEHLTDGHPAVSQKDFTEKHWLKSAQQTRVFRVSGTVWGVQWWGQLVGGGREGRTQGYEDEQHTIPALKETVKNYQVL